MFIGATKLGEITLTKYFFCDDKKLDGKHENASNFLKTGTTYFKRFVYVFTG